MIKARTGKKLTQMELEKLIHDLRKAGYTEEAIQKIIQHNTGK